MLSRQNPGLKRESRRVRGKRDEVIVVQDHARLGFNFLADHVAENAALFFVVVVLRAVHFLAHALGHDRQRDQLRMRMLERCAGGLPVILEKQNVAEAAVVFQIEHAIAIGPQRFLDCLLRHGRKRELMVGRFDDHLVRAHAVHAVEQSVAFAVQVAFDAQRRKFIGHHAQRPSRRVPPAAVASVSKDFRRSLSFIPGTERTNPHSLDLNALAHEIRRAPDSGPWK